MVSNLDFVINALNERRKTAPNGEEYWMGRDIQTILGYHEWRNFKNTIEKARMACESTGVHSEYHFVDANKKVSIGSGAQVPREDCYLTRYACYLIAMNGNPAKPEIGTAQTYFAIQTRRQEKFDQLTNEEKRIELRERVRHANRQLSGAAREAGVKNFASFHDSGYRGLYGMGLREIEQKKQIPPKERLLDCAGRTELAANEFRITQTEQKLNREGVHEQYRANDVHHAVGQEVRTTIKRLDGTMPEDLPAEIPIKKLIKKRRQPKRLTSK